MKYADMNKLYREEKTALKAEIIPVSIFFICLSIFSNLSGQVPLNGFCRFHESIVNPGMEKIIAVDFNGDGYRDIVAYQPSEKQYCVLTFDPKSKQFKNSQRYSPFEFSELRPLGEDKTGGRRFAFTSRKERTAGILSFSRSGSVNVLSRFKSEFYPVNVDVSDIERNGRNELLLSGPSFNGLSVLYESKSGLKENNFGTKKSYSYSSFIDLDYDLFDDIVAVDLYSNTLKFFYNDQTGGFSEQRSMNLNGEISQFQTTDVNLDGFIDFMFIKNKKLEIILGDSVSTFQKKMNINSECSVDKYSVFDFNGDGYNDIAFLNYEKGLLSIAFGETASTFYKAVVLFERKGIIDIVSYVDRGGRKLCALDKNGKLYMIDKAFGFDNDFTSASVVKPSKIGTFNYLNDRTKDFYVVDDYDFLLKIFINAGNNLFDKYYSFNLSKIPKKISVDESDPVRKIFVCYTPGDPLVEVLHINFEDGSCDKEILYADGGINDLKLESAGNQKENSISVISNKSGKSFLQSFDNRDYRYLQSGRDIISSNIVSALFPYTFSNEIFFFTKYSGIMYLNKCSRKSLSSTSINLTSFPFDDEKNAVCDFVNYENKAAAEQPVIAIVGTGVNFVVNIINRGNYNTIKLDGFSFMPGMNNFYFDRNDSRLFLYDKLSGKLKRIIMTGNFSTNIVDDVFESKTVNSYIVPPIGSKKEILIYSDAANNLINFKTIQ
jgi:hypothetical protein